MIKKLIRKQMIGFIILLILLTVLFASVVVFTSVSGYSSTYINQNVYSDANFDYIIPSPGKSQIDVLKSKTFIDNVCPYYTTSLDLTIKSKKIKTNMYFVDDLNALECSPFVAKRIVKSKSANISNSAFIDYVYAQKNNVDLGEMISIGEKTYEVTKIYQPNSLTDGGCVVICWNDALKATLNVENVNYSAAWLKSTDLLLCDNYLKSSYIPEGRIRKQGDSETDQQYQEYLTLFYKNNFYKEVTNIRANGQIANAKILAAKRLVIIEEIIVVILVAVIACIGMYYIYFSNRKRLQIKKAIQANAKNAGLINKNIITMSILLSLVAYVLLALLLLGYKCVFGYYIEAILMVISSIIIGGALVLACVLLLVINKNFIKKYYSIVTSERW
jgi:hypothetical protein